MQQDQVLVGQLAHDAGGLQEGLGRGGWLRRGGGGAVGLAQGVSPPPHLRAVAVAAVHHLEHHLGLVELVLLLVLLHALVDVGEGALGQALALPREGVLDGDGPPPVPLKPPSPPPPPVPPYPREALGVDLVEGHLVGAAARG